jgi:putative molybdopterin biosynthesis protein
MSVYLRDIPLPEAKARFQQALESAGLSGILGKETIPLDEAALGRVLAEPVWAKISSPHYHSAAMDGFAVRAEETAGAMPTAPITLAIGPQAAYVDTGDPMPDWANAVIPIEHVEPLDIQGGLAEDPRHPASIRIRAGVTPWQHVRAMGEDMVASELVLPAGHTLRPVDLGAIAASGHGQVVVSRPPKVAILPTGTELVPIGQPVKPGEIIEFNSVVLAAQVRAWGGEPYRMEIVPDDFKMIQDQVAQAAQEHDLVLLLAGSSAGSEDYSARVVETLGELLVHGVAIRPGHPVILGMINARLPKSLKTSEVSGTSKQVPIIGVPGYPVSAALTGEIFVRPLLSRWLGRPPAEPQRITATLTRKVVSPAGDDDYLRVAVGRVNDRLLAAPLARGAGVISSLVRADGVVVLPRGTQGLPAGEKVQVMLYRSPEVIEQTILAIGSHDMLLDLVAQFLSQRGRRLVSANVGSLGGLVALRRGEAHLAGSHLLDPQTGEYNISYIHQYLPNEEITLVALVGRQQGLIVPAGNPKGIRSLEDLAREEVRFVNRQRGAGTRVLLDYELKMSIDPQRIQGYEQEEYTHLAVAAAVASGKADCGLGIAAAAQALGLDFIPLFQERYDLVIPTQEYRGALLQPLLDLLQEAEFRRMVASLPGYDVTPMGKVIAQISPKEE